MAEEPRGFNPDWTDPREPGQDPVPVGSQEPSPSYGVPPESLPPPLKGDDGLKVDYDGYAYVIRMDLSEAQSIAPNESLLWTPVWRETDGRFYRVDFSTIMVTLNGYGADIEARFETLTAQIDAELLENQSQIASWQTASLAQLIQDIDAYEAATTAAIDVRQDAWEAAEAVARAAFEAGITDAMTAFTQDEQDAREDWQAAQNATYTTFALGVETRMTAAEGTVATVEAEWDAFADAISTQQSDFEASVTSSHASFQTTINNQIAGLDTRVDAAEALAQQAMDTAQEAAEGTIPDGSITVPKLASDTAALIAGKQPLATNLTSFAGFAGAADRLAYFTGAGTLGSATFTAFGRSLLDDADAATARTTLGAAGLGANVFSGMTTVNESFVKITTRGTTSTTPGFDILTKSADAADGLDTATSKGWTFAARSDLYGDSAQRNDFLVDYWDGTNWQTGFRIKGSSREFSVGGKFVSPASTTARASMNIPHGAGPTTPVNGDLWSTTVGLTFRLNGATKQIAFTDASWATANIANDAVTNTKLANMAVNTLKGRVTAGTGDPEDLTVAQTKTMLGIPAVTDAVVAGKASLAGSNVFDLTQTAPAWRAAGTYPHLFLHDTSSPTGARKARHVLTSGTLYEAKLSDDETAATTLSETDLASGARINHGALHYTNQRYLGDGFDLNTMVGYSGTFTVLNPVNGPAAGGWWWIEQRVTDPTAVTRWQVARRLDVTDGAMYERIRLNGTWGAWSVVHTANSTSTPTVWHGQGAGNGTLMTNGTAPHLQMVPFTAGKTGYAWWVATCNFDTVNSGYNYLYCTLYNAATNAVVTDTMTSITWGATAGQYTTAVVSHAVAGLTYGTPYHVWMRAYGNVYGTSYFRNPSVAGISY